MKGEIAAGRAVVEGRIVEGRIYRLVEEAQANIGSDVLFAPEYADDGFSGGRVDEVLRLFREELRLAEEYGLRYDLNNCTLYLRCFPG